jgi:FG-GAP-like repeat/Bacterial Ig domain
MLRVNARSLLLALISMAAVPAAFSQAVSFSPSVMQNLSQVHADFNSDGEEDFISSAGCSGNGLSLVLSNGNGTYAPPVCYSVPGTTVYAFAIGDYNNDGNTDVIVSNGTNHFYQFLGSASGKLHLQADYFTTYTIDAVAAADVNHDGRIDLLFNCYNCSDTNLHVWFGNRDGGFTTGPDTPMSATALGYLSVGDFDGDGKADVLGQSCFASSCTYQVLYGDSTGHFQASTPFTDHVGYTAYDLNGDGRMDLVGVPYDSYVGGVTYSNQVKLLYGTATRTFTPGTVTLKNCTDSGVPIAVSDFNGDGINDILVVEASDCKGTKPETVNVLLGNADGNYQPEQVVYTGTDTELLTQPTVLRANRDTKPDFLLLEQQPPTTAQPNPQILFENTTSANFPACDAPNRYDGITLCSPTSTVVSGSPVQFSIGAANQTAGRKVEVWIDGKKASEQLKHAFSYYSFLDASEQLSNGTHSVTVYSAGWDNLLESVTFPLTVGSASCTPPSSPGLNVCSPINNSTDNSPALAWASGTVTGTIARMEVWVDGVKKYSTYGSNSLKTNVSLASGTHQFSYYIVNTAGQKWNKIAYAMVP